MRTKRFKTVLCAVLSAALIFLTLSLPGAVSALTIEEIREQQKALDKKIEDANKRVEELKKDKEQQENYASELIDQINDIQAQINLFNREIALRQEEIDGIQAKINEKEAGINALNEEIRELERKIDEYINEIAQTKEQLKSRLRTLYINGETSELELLLSAESFTNFLVRRELMDNIAKHDSELIDTLRELAQKLEEDIASLNLKRAELEESRALLEVEQSVLLKAKNDIDLRKKSAEKSCAEIESKWDDVNAVIGAINANSAANKKIIAQAEKERIEFDKKITELLNQSTVVYDGPKSEGFITPLDYSSGGFYVSSEFGMRNGKPHNGADITKNYARGAPVRAVADGRVVSAEWHYSYGNYVLIDHGNGKSTLYAHLDGLYVSAGDIVNQGKTLGPMGNTGNSSGPHLHFEVRVNGSHVNPFNYIKRP